MADLFRDIRHFSWRVCVAWVKTVGGELVAVYQMVYAIKYQQWPPAMSWLVLGLCLLIAFFMAWREQYVERITNPIGQRERLNSLARYGEGLRDKFMSEYVPPW